MQEPFLIAYKKVLYDALFSRGMDEASINALLQYLDYNSNTISDVNSRVQTLENNETIYQLYEFVGQSTSGTVTVPTEGEIYDLYQDGVVDALAVVADENDRPTTTIQTDSNGQEIDVLTLTENGSYTLNAIPVNNTCLLYWIKIQDQYKSNVDESKIIPPILPLGDDTKVTWLYPYVSDTYPKGVMTRVGDWTSISNKTTSEYPVPQYTGEEFNVYDGEMLTDQVTAKQIIFGTRYNSVTSAYVKGYRVYVIAGNEYKLYSVADPLGSKIVKLELEIQATTSGWIDISLAPTLVLANNVFDIVAIVNEPDPTPTIFSGDWNYQKPTNQTAPTSGQITHSSKSTNKLLINYIDNNLGDRGVELKALTVADKIQVSDIQWSIQAIVDNGTYIEFDIAPSTQSTNLGVTSFEFETQVETPITFGIDTDYYITNDDIKGLYVAGDSYDNINVNDNAYGVDLLVQEVIQSEDWDVVASSAQLGSGTSKKGQDLLDQLDVVPEGDDQGVYFKNQVSVLGELVIGKDSYPIPYAWHCKVVDTTGKVIVNAIDRSTIFQSDSGSSAGLFNGISVGDYLLVMAPEEIYEGAKIKYDVLGNVEPDNIISEYYQSDTNTWLPVPIMATNSNPPYEENADQISTHLSEQLYYGFDPLTRDLPTDWELHTFNINGVDYTGYFSRTRIVTAITSDPIVQQIKLHSNSIEIEALGTFYKGFSRIPVQLPFQMVKNDLSDPANEVISYTQNYRADAVDNELANGQKDGFGIIANRVSGLDSSVPVIVSITFYVKGANTGVIDLDYEVSQVIDGFLYNGLEPFTPYSILTTIATPQDLARFTINLIVPINKLLSNSAFVVSLFRDASATRDDDTLTASIIRTSVNVTGYKWKN